MSVVLIQLNSMWEGSIIIHILRNLSIRRKMIILLAVSLFFLLVIGLTGYLYLNMVQKNSERMYSEILLPMEWVNQIRATNFEIQASAFDTIISTDTDRKMKLEDLSNNRTNQVTDLYNLLKESSQNAFQAEKLVQYNKLRLEYMGVQGEVRWLSTQNQNKEAYALYLSSVEPIQIEINQLLTDILNSYDETAQQLKQQNENAGSSASLTMIGLIVLSIILLGLLILMISGMITRPLTEIKQLMIQASGGNMNVRGTYRSKDELGEMTDAFNSMLNSIRDLVAQVNDNSLTLAASAEQLMASAEQTSRASEVIAAATSELSFGLEEQVRSVAMTTDALAVMNVHIGRMDTQAEEMARCTAEAAESSRLGAESVQRVMNQMHEISGSSENTSRIITELGSHSQQIGEIIRLINDVATQTNLLALNATIEAARAGASGLGFSVVAAEIRKLAEQSSDSSKQISNLVSMIRRGTTEAAQSMVAGVQNVHTGIELSKSVHSTFALIDRSVVNVMQSVQEVSGSIREISEGSEGIVAAMDAVSGVTQKGASASQETAAASQEQLATMEDVTNSAKSLAELAEAMQSKLANFNLH
ncbi:methyl-accepting chemotaxis protein [Paenibacillus sp. S3N08]|uniref:Methyl-accepting chemotaxis protein n=1 Tax=Paenibacillus agricola TaxID=2716264 RepID=A0ABX0J8W5_9BACL|nr:methyl-accepting chemotaxis protein [Paenibacillus agricola]